MEKKEVIKRLVSAGFSVLGEVVYVLVFNKEVDFSISSDYIVPYVLSEVREQVIIRKHVRESFPRYDLISININSISEVSAIYYKGSYCVSGIILHKDCFVVVEERDVFTENKIGLWRRRKI